MSIGGFSWNLNLGIYCEKNLMQSDEGGLRSCKNGLRNSEDTLIKEHPRWQRAAHVNTLVGKTIRDFSGADLQNDQINV